MKSWKLEEKEVSLKKIESMLKEDLKNAVMDIMSIDGPDGHTDGSDVITEFIMSVQEGRPEEWIVEYRNKNKILWWG